MDEQTSLTTEESMDTSAFLEGLGIEESSPAGAETQAETTETEATEVTEETPEQPAADQPESMTIKHLGREVNLNPDQVKEYVQKGYDYDRIRSERDTLKAQTAQLETLNQLIKQSGHQSIEAFVKEMQANAQNSKIAQRADALKKEGFYDEQANYIAKVEAERDQAAQAQNSLRQEQERAHAEAEARQGALNDLFAAYPETKNFVAYGDLPESFRAGLEAGKPPIVAWQDHLLHEQQAKFEELNTKLAQYEQNQKNAESAAPSAKGAKPIEKDPFLEGLFG